MIILLNGPLGIGKSTLAEALVEHLEHSVMLDGDKLIAVNPEPANPQEYLHLLLQSLVQHHKAAGYRHFVIDHLWRNPAELNDLRHRLVDNDFHCFLLTLSENENRQRIQRRAKARDINELEYELRMNSEERQVLERYRNGELGEAFDVGASVPELVADMLRCISMSRSNI